MPLCDICSRVFDSPSALRSHQLATRHYVCEHCNKALASSLGLSQHIATAHKAIRFKCPECSLYFPKRGKLHNHQKRFGHCTCGDCNKPFASESALSDHTRDLGHSTEFRCCDCDRNFKSITALEQHLRDATHRPSPSPARDSPDETAKVKCPKCPREFIGARALQQHLQSPRHRPISDLKCISSSCNKSFSTPSGLLHHLESGKCSSGMNRATLNDLVLTHDTDRLITREATDDGLLEADSQPQMDESELSSDEETGIMTPSSDGGVALSLPSSPGIWTPRSGSLSSDSWAGLISRAGTSCPFCPPTRPPFCNETALQQHLQSAVHCDRIFFCPISFLDLSKNGKNSKARAFKTLSGLSQHLESGACKGGSTTFRKVAAYLEMRLRAFSINVKLISS